MTDRERFTSIRARYLKARDREETIREGLFRKYGTMRPSEAWLLKGERDRLDACERAQSKEMDAMFTLLDEVSPRRFRSGVPAWWVMEELTWEDATTTAAMSVIPPVPFGYTQREVEVFAGHH